MIKMNDKDEEDGTMKVNAVNRTQGIKINLITLSLESTNRQSTNFNLPRYSSSLCSAGPAWCVGSPAD